MTSATRIGNGFHSLDGARLWHVHAFRELSARSVAKHSTSRIEADVSGIVASYVRQMVG